MVTLKRALSFWELTLVGVGIILGAGIYVLIGEAAGLSGNMVWLSFIVAAVVASLTGLSYAELASLFPKAGAEFVFTEKAFNKRLAFIIGWLLLVTPIISAAAVSLGFAGYFSAFFNTPIILTAIGALIFLSFILFYGIKESAWFAIICAIIEIIGLIIIIFLGIPYFGSVDYFELPPELGFAGVLAAGALVFFAYIGFEDMANMAEEVKNPTHSVPNAIVMSIIISTVLYILVGIASVSVMGWEALSQSSAPLAEVASVSLGNNAFMLLGAIALFATANTVLLILLAGSRMMYGMARGNVLPKIVGKLHSVRQTPWVAIILLLLASIIFVTIGNIGTVANMTNVTILSTFFVINISAIVLRYKNIKLKRKFKTPINIGKFPVLSFLGAISCFVLILQMEGSILLFGAGVVILGYILSYLFVKKDFKAEKIQKVISKHKSKKR